MNTINTVDPTINQSISNAGILAGNNDKTDSGLASSTVDSVRLASKVGHRRIVSTYETVRFSELVPKQIRAKKLENADSLAARIEDGEILKTTDETDLREDRIFAAIVGMRLMQQSGSDVPKRWVGGFDQPTKEELEAAYRRLTQRVSSPDEVEDAESVHNMRIELLDYYRENKDKIMNINELEQSELESSAA